MPVLSVDLQCGAEEVGVADEEVRRAHDTTTSTFSPVGEDVAASIGTWRAEREVDPQAVEDSGVADVVAPLEERVSDGKAGSFANRRAPAAYASFTRSRAGSVVRGNREGSKPLNSSGATWRRRSSTCSATWSSVERLAVHELERPGPNVEHEIVSAGCPAAVDEPPDPDVGVRAPDVGEHLNHRRRAMGSQSRVVPPLRSQDPAARHLGWLDANPPGLRSDAPVPQVQRRGGAAPPRRAVTSRARPLTSTLHPVLVAASYPSTSKQTEGLRSRPRSFSPRSVRNTMVCPSTAWLTG